MAFQRRFDWDFVKLMPSGMYFCQALGCEITPAAGPGGVNALATSVIAGPDDWARLPRLDPTAGWLAEHVESTRRVRAELGPDVPIVQTLFSPITIAHKLSLNDSFGGYVAGTAKSYRPGSSASPPARSTSPARRSTPARTASSTRPRRRRSTR